MKLIAQERPWIRTPRAHRSVPAFVANGPPRTIYFDNTSFRGDSTNLLPNTCSAEAALPTSLSSPFFVRTCRRLSHETNRSANLSARALNYRPRWPLSLPQPAVNPILSQTARAQFFSSPAPSLCSAWLVLSFSLLYFGSLQRRLTRQLRAEL